MNSPGRKLLTLRRRTRLGVRRLWKFAILQTALVAALCMIVLPTALESGNTETAQSGYAQRATNSGSPSATAAPDSGNSPAPEAPRSERQANKTIQWLEKWLEPQAFSNLLLVIIGGAGIIIGVGTLIGVLDQARIATRNLELNRRLAAAALRQARASEQQTYLSLRARLGLKGTTTPEFRADSEMLFTFVIENYGGKGGFIEEAAIDFTLKPIPAWPTYSFFQVGHPIEAGTTFDLYHAWGPISPSVWSKFTDEKGTVRLSIIGAVKYQTGLGAAPKKLGFCLQYDPHMTRLSGALTFVPRGGQRYNYAE